jgi:hypothetical protein
MTRQAVLGHMRALGRSAALLDRVVSIPEMFEVMPSTTPVDEGRGPLSRRAVSWA